MPVWRALPRTLFLLAALAACLVAAYRDSGDVFAIGTFNPTSQVELCDQFSGPPPNPGDPICSDGLGALPTNSPSDVTSKLFVGVADYDYSLLVSTSPGSGFNASGAGHPSFIGGTHPALGDVIGQVATEFRVEPTPLPCDSPTVLSLKLLNATVDNSTPNSLNPVPAAQTTPSGQGTLENMLTDTGSATTAVGYTPPAGIPANGLPASIDRYPSFLNAMFDPDFTNYGPNGVPFDGDDINGATPPLQPLSRYVANAIAAGLAVELNLVTFGPGMLAAAFPAPHPYSDLTTDMGYTTIAVLGDPTQTQPPTYLENLCTERETLQTLYGESRANPCNGVTTPPCNTTGGIINPAVGTNTGLDRQRTPPNAGIYLYLTYTQSQRDVDGDGYENSLDTCPTIANADGSPKTTAGLDMDMIDSACDPTPAVNTNAGNHDLDVAPNGAAIINVTDNCPLIANGTQDESERQHNVYEPFATNPAPQGGPKTDRIGDACDADDVQANGAYLADLDLTAKCVGGTDADGDGYCVATGSGVSTVDPNDANAAITPEDYDLMFVAVTAHASSGANPPERLPTHVCNDGVDNDGDFYVDVYDSGGYSGPANLTSCRPQSVQSHPNYPTCPVNGCPADSDGDGSTNEAERHMGTNPLARCGPGDVPARSDAWPIDLVSNGVPNSTDRVNLLDLTSFLAPIRRLDTGPEDPNWDVRWDIFPGPAVSSNWVIIGDLVGLFAGSTGFPPMNSGERVFSQPFLCTPHPVFGR
jgi:hypothetical protein